MKRIRRIVAVAVAPLLPLAATAQKNIDNAICTFGTNAGGKYGVWRRINDKSPKGAYCTKYEFRLPKSEEKKLAFLEKAFYQDVPDAYDVFIKKADDTSKSNKLITFGANLEKSMSLGWPDHKSGRNYLFMFVRSKADANFRYVYGLEWHYKGKNVEGYVVKIYSLDPKKVKQDKSLLPNSDKAYHQSAADDLASLQDDLEDLKELAKLNNLKSLKNVTKLAKSLAGKVHDSDDAVVLDGTALDSIDFDGIDFDGDKTILSSGKQRLVINGDGSMWMDDGEGNTMQLDGKGNVTSMTKARAKENQDPIQQFANMRVAYLSNLRMVKGYGVNTPLTGLANSILDLCKTKGRQMSTAERQLCVEGLKELQEATPDKFIKGIFGVAMDRLNSFPKKDY